MDVSLLWIPATLAAALAQVVRNATQRGLTELIGTLGATQVRFLYGCPFALLFLALALVATGERLPGPGPNSVPFLLLGSVAQIAATGLMLAAMRLRSFSVVTALIKTEPVLLAGFAFAALGERPTAAALVAIVVATAGVAAVSWTPKVGNDAVRGGVLPVALGLLSAACFALSAVGFRGAILGLDGGSFLVRAATALAGSLLVQTALLGAWLAVFARPALFGSFREWRRSLGAGFVGALGSQFWFIAFALTAAANVRTLALVEIVLAQLVSRRMFSQGTSPRELVGIGLICAGVAVLLGAH